MLEDLSCVPALLLGSSVAHGDVVPAVDHQRCGCFIKPASDGRIVGVGYKILLAGNLPSHQVCEGSSESLS